MNPSMQSHCFTPLRIVFALFVSSLWFQSNPTRAQSDIEFKIGIIGLDTSHAPEFTKLINAPGTQGGASKQRVTHAFPGGSQDIESSRTRVAGYTKQLEDMGIAMVTSVEELVSQVDGVLLLSLDGRKHLQQLRPVMNARKPVFIDKPLSGSLAEAIAIQRLGSKTGTRWFTSSSLRYSPEMIRYREDQSRATSVKGAISWGPCSLEPTHPDLYWYGVHGVETLYTAMGQGCETVTRVHTEGTDVAIGRWRGGRIGEFRGLREGASGYGLVVFGDKSIEVGGKYEGYGPLVERIRRFFALEYEGVDTAESIEMFAFMEAADESKRQGGKPISIGEVMSEAEKEAIHLVP